MTEILDRPAWATALSAPDSPGAQAVRASKKDLNGAAAATVARGDLAGTTCVNGDRNTFIQRREEPEANSDGKADRTISGGQPIARTLTVALPVETSNGNGGRGLAVAMAAVAAAAACDTSGGLKNQPLEEGTGDMDKDVCAEAEVGVIGGGSLESSGGGQCALPTTGSALNLRDGGFAPGEEGCGRDEEL